jgi:hypothetical protein
MLSCTVCRNSHSQRRQRSTVINYNDTFMYILQCKRRSFLVITSGKTDNQLVKFKQSSIIKVGTGPNCFECVFWMKCAVLLNEFIINVKTVRPCNWNYICKKWMTKKWCSVSTDVHRYSIAHSLRYWYAHFVGNLTMLQLPTVSADDLSHQLFLEKQRCCPLLTCLHHYQRSSMWLGGRGRMRVPGSNFSGGQFFK